MTCTHPRIITYHDANTGQPVQLWACAECGHRFEPMQLDDTALLRQALEALEESVGLIEMADIEGDTVRTARKAAAALKQRLGETK